MVSLRFSLGLASLGLAFGATAAPLRILTYSSLLGKGSLGEYLQKEFPKHCKGCSVQFKSTDEINSLPGRLRAEKKKKTGHGFDAVLGLDSRYFHIAQAEDLVKNGVAFDQSSLAIIVDTQRFPEKNWPKSWSEISRLNASLLISDPRLSSPGFAWLRSIFVNKLQSLENSKKLVARVFPSWSSAYDAFLKGEGKAVWSYQSSEAYHRCHEKTETEKTRYRALPLKEGYPAQVEFFAEASFASHPQAKNFSDFLLSRKVQTALPLLNWMFPAVEGTPLPDCFQGIAPFKVSPDSTNFTKADVEAWTDQWAL